MRILFFFILILGFTVPSRSQNAFELGGEYMRSIGQGFSGTITGIRGDLIRSKNSFSIGLVYQFSSKSSYSSGSGFGIYGNFRHGFGSNPDGNNLFLGAKVLFNLLSWQGKSSLFSPMITPIGEAGYHFVFGEHVFTAPSIGYGYTLRILPDYNSLDEDAGGRFIPSISAGLRF